MNHPIEQFKSAVQLSSLAEIADLIAPADTPSWLKEYLQNWAPSLMLDRGVWAMQPTKVEMRQRMLDVSNAASLLHDALGDASAKEFLEGAGEIRIDNIGGLQRTLQLIAERAKQAAAHSAISTKAGIAKSGRGKAAPPDTYAPKVFCALVIAEAWKFMRSKYPAPRNRIAAQATHEFWKACGGPTTGWGSDPLNAWRPYFIRARAPEAEKERVECARQLMLYKQSS